MDYYNYSVLEKMEEKFEANSNISWKLKDKKKLYFNPKKLET